VVTLAQLRAINPAALTAAATELMGLNHAFNAALDGAHQEVTLAMEHWQGDGAAAAATRSAADHVTGSHLGTAVDAQIDALNDAGASLGSARQTVLDIANDALHSGCTLDDEGHVRAPDMGGILLLQVLAEEKARTFEARLVAAMHTFDELDAKAAAALQAATDAVADLVRKPEGAPPSDRAASFISGQEPIPADPKAFHDLWVTLTPAEKDALWRHDQYLGNHDGMPAVDRDHYNRVKLADESARAAAAQVQVDQLTQQHPDWARGDHIPHNEPGARFRDVDDYNLWKRDYDDAENRAKNLSDLRAVNQTLTRRDTMLLLLDTQTGGMAHAAVAVGNPDAAQHISVTAPGLNTTVGGSLDSMVQEADNLNATAERELKRYGRRGETVATVAWIGADLPQIDKGGNLDKLAGAVEVAGDGLAKAGAPSLAHFYDGLGAAHEGPKPQITAVGHSYGSLMTGLALQQPGSYPVTDLVVYGSPGLDTGYKPWDNALDKLHLEPGHAFEMTAHDDPVANLNGFGLSPGYTPGFTDMDTSATTTPDGVARDGASGHAEYARNGSNGELRTSGYNTAVVIGGLPDKVVQGAPAWQTAGFDLEKWLVHR
jgi:Alpha/beta hydrolase